MTETSGPRRMASLDGTWRFVPDPELVYAPGGTLPAGVVISVPAPWEAQVPNPFGIVHAWYWRELEVPIDWPRDGVVVVYFEAVMYRCEVFLNGRAVADHEGGYTPFEVDLTDARRDRPNHLALRITNPMNAITEYPGLSDERLDRAERRVPQLPIREIPHGKQTWYASHSGPWRSVRLEWRPAVSINHLRARADWATGSVRVTAAIDGPAGGQLELDVFGRGGVVARASVPVAAAVEAALLVPDRLAWDIDQPNLYRLEARLVVEGTVVDRVGTRFGFREIRTERGRVMLNGRPILLRGALDQDVYPDTIAIPPDRDLLARQLRSAREMGLNLLRCHIKVPDPAYLDAADEAGVLLWCELPNWIRLTPGSARRGEALLDELVEAVGDHPSAVIWTVINEDWGTDLRHSADDRRWLRRTTQRLRQLDPTRLVVDNSPCPTDAEPNFHLETDIADFHRYAAMPDAAPRWRDQMAELAKRPDWLWSPHGDAVRSGEEPVVLSEFGTWGLPDPAVLHGAWWAETGDGSARPGGMADRFAVQRLDRVWPGPEALAAATRALQLEALRYQVGEIRRHAGLAGLVVTEFTDAFWEANGLLNLDRSAKMDPALLAEFLGEVALVVDLPRRDLWGGERITARVTVSAERSGTGGALRWRLGSESGSVRVDGWEACVPTIVAELALTVPDVDATTDTDLVVELLPRSDAATRATLPVAIVPGQLQTSRADHSPSALLVRTQLSPEDLDRVDAGARLLLLAGSHDALLDGLPLERPVRVEPRWPAHDRPGADFTWTGDWIGAFSWLLPGLSTDLPLHAPLDFVYQAVLADHVLRGYDPSIHASEAWAGLFVGWVHAPAALGWSFPQGLGRLTITTLKLDDRDGPVAVLLSDAVIRLASA